MSTAYEYRDEGVAVLAARRSSLHGALLAAKAAGHSHVIVDGTLLYTDRISTPGPTSGVDLWWSGKHHHHGGNVQVVSALDGWPLWTSDVRPGREHDTSAARADPTCWPGSPTGSATAPTRWPIWATKANPKPSRSLSRSQKTDNSPSTNRRYNAIHGALRCLGERANSLLKTTYKALRRYRGCPWRLGDIAAAALVLLHHEHHRTT